MRHAVATSLSIAMFILAGCAAREPVITVVNGEARSADGLAIRYQVRGTSDPTLVLVHGWTNSSGIWGEHPNALSRTHRVVTLDLAGHGASDDGRADWTVGAFGEDVVAVVEQLALNRVVLIGFSMGADVVLKAAERIPERVIGIIFIDALHDPDESPSLADAAQLESVFRANWRDTAFVRAFAFTPDTPDSLVWYVTGMMPAQPREHWFPALRASVLWRDTELIPTLQRTQVPVAAINTTRLPTNVGAMQRYVSSFTLDTIAGVGHAGILLQRVEDFDARLLAIVERFAVAAPR
jgi:pimeloyl-ACP methyl ester carboxylesterase